MSKSALIVTDIQYDICDGGPLANVNSLSIIPKINSIHDNYDLIIFTKKTYNKDHILFKKQYPEHCVVNTPGANLHSELIVYDTDIIINRCTPLNSNSNSAFWDDENVCKETKLHYFLKVHNIKDLYFCGNNMDTCIFSTIMDAINYGYQCFVLKDMIGYCDKEKCDDKIKFLDTMGIIFK